jgi:low affinity Fe/Cu permease
MNKKYIKLAIAITFLAVILTAFTSHNAYQITIICAILTFILVGSVFLQAHQEEFYEKLNSIKSQAVLAKTPEDLLTLRNELTDHSKKAYNTHAKYNVDLICSYINSRLKHDFK